MVRIAGIVLLLPKFNEVDTIIRINTHEHSENSIRYMEDLWKRTGCKCVFVESVINSNKLIISLTRE